MRDLAGAAWTLAMTAIAEATGEPLESVRIFLDTSHGRYLADEVHNGLSRGLSLAGAIDVAIQRWMGWTIGSQTYKTHGIPQGLPYLTGFVIHCAILDELQAD